MAQEPANNSPVHPFNIQHVNTNQDFFVLSDIKRFQQILINLQSNAIKFSNQNSEVHIICKYQHPIPIQRALTSDNMLATRRMSGNEIVDRINQQTNKPKLIVEVQDNGFGMSQEQQEKLFKMFATNSDSSHTNTSGIGLGLFISQTLLQQFNGLISVVSEVGRGTTFTFSFELNQEHEPHNVTLTDNDENTNIEQWNYNSRPRSAIDNPGAKCRILNHNESVEMPLIMEQAVEIQKRVMVVDDEPFNVQALVTILRLLGLPNTVQIDTCYNGQEAVNLVKRAIDENEVTRYPLILSDCSMPVLDGYKASRQIREMIRQATVGSNYNFGNERLQIIAITGHVEQEFVEKALNHGMDEVLSKPVDVYDLAHVLLRVHLIDSIPASVQQQS